MKARVVKIENNYEEDKEGKLYFDDGSVLR